MLNYFTTQEQSTTDIWRCICKCVQRVLKESQIDPSGVQGIGFDATCSLAVFSHDIDEPISVTGLEFSNDGDDCNNVILVGTETINATKHNPI
jgi:ribulose kinase